MLRPGLLTNLELSVRSINSDILTASIRQVAPSSHEELQHSEYHQLLKSSSVQEAIDFDPSNSMEFGESVHQGNHPLSAHNSAPIQMTLRDHVMWPTNQKGFSMSLWLRLEGTNEEANLFARKIRRTGKNSSFRESTSAEQSTSKSAV